VTFALSQREIRAPWPDHGLATVTRDRFDTHIQSHAQADVRSGAAMRVVIEMDEGVMVQRSDGAT